MAQSAPTNRHSQLGEERIIATLAKALGVPRTCCEFGAGDGVTLSNTAALLEDGWWGILAEGDPAKADACRCHWRGYPMVQVVETVVLWGEENGVDALMGGRMDCSVLSIDVDGNDWHIWKAVRKHRPAIVCIEFNPTFPIWAEWVQAADPTVNQGASLGALVRLGRDKGYQLVATTDLNAIFVTDEGFARLPECHNNDLRAIAWRPQYWTWTAFGYDGTEIRGGLDRPIWPARDGRYKYALKNGR